MKKKNWHEAPSPFNLDARPGLHGAVSDAYARWCDDHPTSTQEERKKAYARLYDELRHGFPSYRELGQ